jgi:hypothetical protein
MRRRTQPAAGLFVHRLLGEPLRSGHALTRDLRRQGCSIWVYTSSGRTPAYIRRWLMLYGIRVDGVVNSVLHNRALTVHGLSNTPSKFPPAFDIDCMSMIPKVCAVKAMTMVSAWSWWTRRTKTGRECWMPSLMSRRNSPGSNRSGTHSLRDQAQVFSS